MSFILPNDKYNSILAENTHPANWKNPEPKGIYNLVVIGAGAAGFTAAGSSGVIGGKVALIERHFTGGDCLVSGCVPSKGIISAARLAASFHKAQGFGITAREGVKVGLKADTFKIFIAL